MKPKHIILATMLTSGLPAGAAPFTHRTTGLSSAAGLEQMIFFQADTDANVEIYTGGNQVLHPVPGGTGASTDLPGFDFDPYQSNWPVTFVDGRGAVGDIDGDGDMDLVRSAMVAYNGTIEPNYRMMTCVNNGSGQFTRGWHFKQTTEVTGMWEDAPHLALADFDRDGDLDLVDNFPGVRIHWNGGSGDFGASIVTLNSSFTHLDALAVGDFDGNGWPDIAACVQLDLNSDPNVYVWTGRLILLSNEGGTFTASTVSTLPAHVKYSGAVATDLNGDGKTDLLACVQEYSGARTLYNYRSTGTGFVAPVPLVTSSPSWDKAFTAGDLNEDGITDIVFSDYDRAVKWLRGTGGGNFAAVATIYTANLTTAPAGIALGDLDGDGDNDLLLASGARMLENTAMRRYPAATVTSNVSLSGVTKLTVADFNQDGRDDIVVVTPSQQKLWLFHGEADGSPAAGIFKNTQSQAAHSVAAGDFNVDGLPDVAYTLPGSGQVRLAANTGGFNGWLDTAVATDVPGASLIVPGFFGTPGKPDLLTASSTTGQLRWLYHDGFTWTGRNVLSSSDPAPGCIMAADAVPRPGTEPFLLAANGSSYYLKGFQLNPTWMPVGTDYAAGVSVNPLPLSMTWADVTGDGKPEVVHIRSDARIGWWDPVGPAAGLLPDANSAPRVIAPVDWNRDGRTDILAATANGLTLYYYRDSGWTSTQILENAAGFDSLAIMDLDRDGLMDAAAANTASGLLRFVRNDSRILLTSTLDNTDKNIPTGQTGTVLHLNPIHPGRPAADGRLADVSVAPVQATVFLRKAVASGNSWTPGGALTKAELQQMMTSMSLFLQDEVVGTASSAALDGSGRLSIAHNQALGNPASIPAGGFGDITLRLSLSPTAHSAAHQRFFVTIESIQARILDGLSPDEPALHTNSRETALITIVPPLSALQQWRQTNFNNWQSTGTAANDADPDGDGVPNLMEYLTSQNPNAAGGIGSTAVVGLTHQAGNMFADLRLLTTYDNKVKLTLQYSFNPAANWSLLSTRTGTGAWSGIMPASTALNGGRTRWSFDGGFATAIFRKAFFRLKAEELP